MSTPLPRIAMIVPVPVPDAALDAFARQIPQTLVDRSTVEFRCPTGGGGTLDSYYEGAIADYHCVEAGIAAAEDGCDLVCINSMSDSGIPALRSRLSIPVVATAHSTYAAASQLGRRFSIIGMWDRWNWFYHKVIGEHGLTDRLASIRSIDVPPDTSELLEGKEDFVFPRLKEAAQKALDEDGADVLILGSTTMHQSHAFLQDAFDVPVLNPGLIAFKTCEMWLALGLAQSARAYQPPRAS